MRGSSRPSQHSHQYPKDTDHVSVNLLRSAVKRFNRYSLNADVNTDNRVMRFHPAFLRAAIRALHIIAMRFTPAFKEQQGKEKPGQAT